MKELVLSVCELLHREAEKLLYPGAKAIDGTVGNGTDTVFLCKNVGESGLVYGFDIQEQAIEETNRALEAANLAGRAVLICDGHEHIAAHLSAAESIDCAVFNLGYLPGGDHDITTKKATTLQGIEAAMARLKPYGAVFIALYWGHPEGLEEKDALQAFITALPKEKWCVQEVSFPNRSKAPIFIIIQKKGFEVRKNGNKSVQTKNDSEDY